MSRWGPRTALFALAACVALLIAAPGASAAVPSSLYNPSNCATDTTAPENYIFCDDGVPSAGGTTANGTGAKAITVPALYKASSGGDNWTGLPLNDFPASASQPGADTNGDIALDADVSIPNSPPPVGGYPLIIMMHGCCGGDKTSWEAQGTTAGQRFATSGERWHYNNAWFASRGYVVLNYTARGFVNGSGNGSTGQTQLDSRRYEINDMQSLACQVYANAGNFGTAINPNKVVATGGSYGGGFSWMALADPKWTCTPDTGTGVSMSLGAVAPKYGWTDLVDSLVPTGYQSESPTALPDTQGCDEGPVRLDGTACPGSPPVGIPKRSIVSGLYATGKGLIPNSPHTTFSSEIDQAFACLSGPYPFDQNPACNALPGGSINDILREFLNDRSAYYQNQFFANIAADPSYRIPIFDAATLTDTLFPDNENRRMINRLLSVVPSYPIQAYYGDYQHFTQNKPKIWGDVCNSGGREHVCTNSDFAGNFNANPASMVRQGVTTRLNRFIDHYAAPSGDAGQPTPSFDVTAELQVCDQNAAALGASPDAGGPQFEAPSFEQLAPNTLSANLVGTQMAASSVVPNTHATDADPVANQQLNGAKCVVESSDAGGGVASYDTFPLPSTQTMIGATRVTVAFSGSGTVTQMDARLYDVFPDGSSVLVDRGPRRVKPSDQAAGQLTFEVHGNGWRFAPGHKIRIELTQDDDPYLAQSSASPSLATITNVHLAVPVREASSSIGGGPTRLRRVFVRLRCPRRARPGGCRIRAIALSRRRHGRRMTRVTRVRLRAGRSRVVALRVRPAFQLRLDALRRVLVRERITMAGQTRTIYRRLGIIRR